MLRKSVHDMLKLPKDWRRLPAGGIAVDLAKQVDDQTIRTEVWRHLIGAAFDGLVAWLDETRGRTARIEEQPALTWRINDAVFVYLPEIDYDFLDRCVDLATLAFFVTVLTPPRRDIPLHKVLAAILDEKVPCVMSVDTYLSCRVLFSHADLNCTHDQAVLALLKRYNERSLIAWPDRSILIEMPTT
jgi:hypothetical protein